MQSPWQRLLSKLDIRSHELGLMLGAASILTVIAVSFTLMFQIGTSNREIDQFVYSEAVKQANLARLDKKFAELQAVPGNLREIPNLDMPNRENLDITLASVDLFGRTFTRQEMCIAQAVYFEARSEPLVGQIAIAEVILNRIADPRYPSTACEVVFQNQDRKHRCQFSFACDGIPDRPTNASAWEKALKVVALVMKGERSGIARRATHYHATYVSPGWSERLSKLGQVGTHIFYREELI